MSYRTQEKKPGVDSVGIWYMSSVTKSYCQFDGKCFL